MKTLKKGTRVLILVFGIAISQACSQKGFEWQAEAHTKDLDKKKGYKQKKHRANYHRYGQHHKKKN